MTNSLVGQTYQSVIDEVVDSSRVDFEEGGVEESVLEELRQEWQKKLSALNVAHFPWDPKPEPVTQPNPSMNHPSTYTLAGPSGAQNAFVPATLSQNMMPMESLSGPRIKAEPGQESGVQGVQAFAPTMTGNGAAQRAAQILQNNYGARAAASISAIQSGMPSQQQAPPQNLQQIPQPGMPPIMHQQQHQRQPQSNVPRPQFTQAQYNQAMAQQTAAQNRANAQSSQASINKAQTDGSADMEQSIIFKDVRSDGQVKLGRIEIDNMLREQIEARGRAMEGGGLMLPFKQRRPSGRSRTLKSGNNAASERLGPKSSMVGVGQVDGGDDSSNDDKSTVIKSADDDDGDAINSDLDDPDEALNEDEDDEDGMSQIMLCMYDKVQRVKNKWKCVMKDGVLTVNGREYVFHKATGEYEW